MEFFFYLFQDKPLTWTCYLLWEANYFKKKLYLSWLVSYYTLRNYHNWENIEIKEFNFLLTNCYMCDNYMPNSQLSKIRHAIFTRLNWIWQVGTCMCNSTPFKTMSVTLMSNEYDNSNVNNGRIYLQMKEPKAKPVFVHIHNKFMHGI